jgi:hypothetical protein
METKTCNTCHQPKPATLEFFHKYPRNADGFRGECKVCHKAQKRAWEASHPEQVREAKRRRTAANPHSNRRRANQWRKDNPERYKANMRNWYEENKDAVREAMRADRKNNPRKYREYELKKKFGITLAEFDALLEKQGGKCAACGATEPGGKYNQWAVDHDHACCPGRKTCGKCIRGILCNGCNAGIGFLKDDAENARKAAEYLERTKDCPEPDKPSAPLNVASVAVINSIINARVPEENHLRATEEEVLA